jgi:hypothetical protein
MTPGVASVMMARMVACCFSWRSLTAMSKAA